MPDLHDPPPNHQPPPHLAALASLIDAAASLLEHDHPTLARGRPPYLPPIATLLTDLRTWQTHATSPPTPPPDEPPPLDLTDPAALRAWLTALRTQLDDALSAGEDATRPPSHRDLGRRTARAHLLASRAALASLLAAAAHALPHLGPEAP